MQLGIYEVYKKNNGIKVIKEEVSCHYSHITWFHVSEKIYKNV